MKKMMILGLMLVSGACLAASDVVTLRDGTTLEEAVVVRLNPATYIVQTPDALYELSDDELDPGTMQGRSFRDERPPVVTHHYDEVHADGTATRYWSLLINNRDKKALTEIRMGLAFWERAMVDQRTFVDDRGTRLNSIYEPPREKWASQPKKIIRHILPLAVPLAPGENMTLTGSETSPHVRQTAEGLLYRHHGDYSEDRLVWLKVRLPQGAKIVRTSPAPSSRFEQDGSQYLMWRRYYQQGEVFPLEVVYSLD